jgi:hypothetical protein
MSVRLHDMPRADGNGAQCEPTTVVMFYPLEAAGSWQLQQSWFWLVI